MGRLFLTKTCTYFSDDDISYPTQHARVTLATFRCSDNDEFEFKSDPIYCETSNTKDVKMVPVVPLFSTKH